MKQQKQHLHQSPALSCFQNFTEGNERNEKQRNETTAILLQFNKQIETEKRITEPNSQRTTP